MRLVVLALMVVRLLTGQTSDSQLPPSIPPAPGQIKVQATLRYVDIRAGDGAEAKAGQQYTVRYTGWLRDGTRFDSSEGRDPLRFVQGRREVIPGFDAAFEGMKVGGKRRVFIPWQLAYGEQGRGPIPPKAELIFDIELVDAKDALQLAAAADLLFPFEEAQSHVLALANAVPEEKYAWRPGPGVRSFQEVFLHIAYGNQLLLNIANNQPPLDALQKQIEDNAKNESQTISRDAIIRILRDSFDAVHKTLDAERAASLGRTIDFFGKPATRRGVLTQIDTHIAEHLGQLIAYARVNGITPPWSR